jgi:serine/threonine protein kinase
MGDLVQGKNVGTMCLASNKLVMVKKTTPEAGRREYDLTSSLSTHPNVATLRQCFEMEDFWYMQYDYSRFTLEEVLNVHLRLEESHIQVIASSVMIKETSPAQR